MYLLIRGFLDGLATSAQFDLFASKRLDRRNFGASMSLSSLPRLKGFLESWEKIWKIYVNLSFSHVIMAMAAVGPNFFCQNEELRFTHTAWIFQEFSATQIFTQNQFRSFWNPKNCHFDHLSSFEFLEIISIVIFFP